MYQNTNSPKISPINLTLIQTTWALTRTFLALIKTSAIFAGIASILLEKSLKKTAQIILVLTIIITIYATIKYYIHYNKFHSLIPEFQDTDLYHASHPINLDSIIYSILLIIILFILLIYSFTH